FRRNARIIVGVGSQGIGRHRANSQVDSFRRLFLPQFLIGLLDAVIPWVRLATVPADRRFDALVKRAVLDRVHSSPPVEIARRNLAMPAVSRVCTVDASMPMMPAMPTTSMTASC